MNHNVKVMEAIRFILARLVGSDMYITIYVPDTEHNEEEVEYLMSQFPDGLEYDYVPITFATMHPEYFRVTGCADVEECYYFDKITVPRRKVGQSIEEWLGGTPKHINWIDFLCP